MKYKKPEIELVKLKDSDVITSSLDVGDGEINVTPDFPES